LEATCRAAWGRFLTCLGNITDKDGKKLKDAPLAGVEGLSLLGWMQTQAVQTLADRSIPIAYMTLRRIVAVLDSLLYPETDRSGPPAGRAGRDHEPQGRPGADDQPGPDEDGARSIASAIDQ
jgi:hypothetical protein